MIFFFLESFSAFFGYSSIWYHRTRNKCYGKENILAPLSLRKSCGKIFIFKQLTNTWCIARPAKRVHGLFGLLFLSPPIKFHGSHKFFSKAHILRRNVFPCRLTKIKSLQSNEFTHTLWDRKKFAAHTYVQKIRQQTGITRASFYTIYTCHVYSLYCLFPKESQISTL